MQCKHIPMLDLRRLAHLVALADERHFARAAEQMHLSQPAFSRSIQALERNLGQRLFERETGEVRPTPAGVFLIDKARRLLFDARCLQRDAELYALGDLGDARFGACGAVAIRGQLALAQGAGDAAEAGINSGGGGRRL